MKNTFLLLTLFTSIGLSAQSLNPVPSIINPGTADTFTGGYTFAYKTSGTPWNGALISFGGFSNNYDTQLSADYILTKAIIFPSEQEMVILVSGITGRNSPRKAAMSFLETKIYWEM